MGPKLAAIPLRGIQAAWLAFDYLSDFSNTRDWDPGVVEAEPLVPGPPDVGSLYRVVAAFLGRRVELRYEVTEFEPPKRLVLEAHSSSVYSHDEIRVEGTREGTRVTYDAQLELKGLLALADPILGLVFRSVGSSAWSSAASGTRRWPGSGRPSAAEATGAVPAGTVAVVPPDPAP